MLYKRYQFLEIVREYIYDVGTGRVLAITRGVVTSYERGSFPDYGYFSDAIEVMISLKYFDEIFLMSQEAKAKKARGQALMQEAWEMLQEKNERAIQLFSAVSTSPLKDNCEV